MQLFGRFFVFLHQNHKSVKVLLSEDIWQFDLRSALEDISPQRREQALKFKHEQGQRLCVLAYLLLKQGLREEYGIMENPVFEYNEHGKPSIIGHPEVFFNISHCREAVICVVSSRPVGVDVESYRSFSDSLIHYTMNDTEITQIQSAEDPRAAFIRLWTMKEATLKLSGHGISNDMRHVIDDDKISYTTVGKDKYVYTVCEEKVNIT